MPHLHTIMFRYVLQLTSAIFCCSSDVNYCYRYAIVNHELNFSPNELCLCFGRNLLINDFNKSFCFHKDFAVRHLYLAIIVKERTTKILIAMTGCIGFEISKSMVMKKLSVLWWWVWHIGFCAWYTFSFSEVSQWWRWEGHPGRQGSRHGHEREFVSGMWQAYHQENKYADDGDISNNDDHHSKWNYSSRIPGRIMVIPNRNDKKNNDNNNGNCYETKKQRLL